MSEHRFLIVEARFYEKLADAQLEGAVAALEAEGIPYDRVTVPGVLEIPAAISYSMMAGRAGYGPRYDGYVALGCVIRGETTHYEIVSNESARALMDLSVNNHLSLGNGILTVENEAQAWDRALRDRKDKAGEAAKAAVAMMRLKQQMTGGR
ncbi:MAG: 6,7-dimethyl-8-ribityllumazine synthase [Flavobacteriaceae bacterium]